MKNRAWILLVAIFTREYYAVRTDIQTNTVTRIPIAGILFDATPYFGNISLVAPEIWPTWWPFSIGMGPKCLVHISLPRPPCSRRYCPDTEAQLWISGKKALLHISAHKPAKPQYLNDYVIGIITGQMDSFVYINPYRLVRSYTTVSISLSCYVQSLPNGTIGIADI